jgi:hypothetical protein
MALVIETFLTCDICFSNFGVDDRHLNGTQQRESAKNNGWIYSGKKDMCPSCRPIKKNGEYPKKHNRGSGRYVSIPLKNHKGHATFIGEPSKESIDAVNVMADLAYKKLK